MKPRQATPFVFSLCLIDSVITVLTQVSHFPFPYDLSFVFHGWHMQFSRTVFTSTDDHSLVTDFRQGRLIDSACLWETA